MDKTWKRRMLHQVHTIKHCKVPVKPISRRHKFWQELTYDFGASRLKLLVYSHTQKLHTNSQYFIKSWIIFFLKCKLFFEQSLAKRASKSGKKWVLGLTQFQKLAQKVRIVKSIQGVQSPVSQPMCTQHPLHTKSWQYKMGPNVG